MTLENSLSHQIHRDIGEDLHEEIKCLSLNEWIPFFFTKMSFQ